MKKNNHRRSWFYWFHVVRRFVNKYPEYQIFNLDALTYAGNLENIVDIENAPIIILLSKETL
jgi:dTDP-D-glucose 4,6-dehydratase